MSPPPSQHDEDIDGFDDFPVTHLEDEEYDEFLSKEFDGDGRLRGEPRVRWVIGLAIVLLLVLIVVISQ